MSFEAIEIVNRTEAQSKERKSAAELEAKNLIAEAERSGLALLEQARAQAAAEGKQLVKEAESRAESRCAKIREDTRSECDALAKQASGLVSKAVERIVGKVVNR